ncbi:MAG: sigma-70 family RNA polymerase sigma factor, partial [Elusimicrobia bacterium]|nr:sigma-70 family RNA polymerase sigma factor [Elusimicrobiota bacterium]
MKTCKSFARDGKGNDVRTAGREGRFERLLRRHARRAYQFAYRLAGNSEDARELVQEASYQALRYWERYEPLDAFLGWYLTMLKRLFLDSRKSAAFRLNVSLNLPGGQAAAGCLEEVLADGEPGPQEQLERQERA